MTPRFEFAPPIRLATTDAAIAYTLASLDDFDGAMLRPGQIVRIVLLTDDGIEIGDKVDVMAVVSAVRAKQEDGRRGLTFAGYSHPIHAI